MLNSVKLYGRLVVTPELKTTNSGISVTSFVIAVDRDYQRQGEEKQTDFIDIVAWRQTAEFITRYFEKGKLIIIDGSIQTRKWEAQDGTKRKVVEVVADKVYFAGDKKENETYKATSTGVELNLPENEDGFTPLPNDDLPF